MIWNYLFKKNVGIILNVKIMAKAFHFDAQYFLYVVAYIPTI